MSILSPAFISAIYLYMLRVLDWLLDWGFVSLGAGYSISGLAGGGTGGTAALTVQVHQLTDWKNTKI